MNLEQLHRDAIIFDGHCDTLLVINDGQRRLGERSAHGQVDIPRMIEGGMTAQIFAIWMRKPMLPIATKHTLQVLDTFYNELDANSDKMQLALKADDIEAAKARGTTAAVLALEGCEALAGDLGLLRMFHRLGVRSIGLTWNWRNQAGDGVGERRTGGGLTTFGVDLVREMNRLSMMIDVAHLSPAGIRDVLEVTEAPVINSHTGATALVDDVRNQTDDQLESLARNGGVACAVYYPGFLELNAHATSLPKLLDTIEHMVKVVGVDHVGLGSDFDGPSDPTILVRGLEDVSRLPALTAGLVERGFKPEDVRKILGGNLLRVFRQVAG